MIERDNALMCRLEILRDNPGAFDQAVTQATADDAIRRIARLEGYAEALERRIKAVRVALGG